MSDPSSTEDPGSQRAPWSRPSVLLSGAFLLALVLLGVIVAVTGAGSGAGLSSSRATATGGAHSRQRRAGLLTRSCSTGRTR